MPPRAANLGTVPIVGLRGSPLLRRFGSGVLWNVLALAGAQGSTLAVNILVANIVGQARFGEFAIVLSTIQTLTLVGGLALGYTATRYVAEHRSAAPVRAGRVITMTLVVSLLSGSIIAIGGVLIAPTLAAGFFKSPDLMPLLRLAALTVPFAIFNSYLSGVLVGLEAFRKLGLVNLAAGTVYLLACTWLAARFGVGGALAGVMLSSIFQAVLALSAVRGAMQAGGIRWEMRGLRAERHVITQFAIPAALSGFTSLPALWLAQAFLVRTPSGYDQLALYSASYSLLGMALFVPVVANGVGMAVLNHLRTSAGSDATRDFFRTNLIATTLLTLTGAGVMLLVGPYLLRAFGDSFAAGKAVLLVLLLAAIPEALTVAMNQALQMRERLWHALALINLPRDLVIPMGAFFLAPQYGALGVAIAYVLGRTLACTIMYFTVRVIGLESR